MQAYDKGDSVRVSASFTVGGVDTDPTAITFKFRTPTGTLTTYTHGVDGALVKDSTGNYHVDLTVSESGEWQYRFAGTGNCIAAGEGEFWGKPSKFS